MQAHLIDLHQKIALHQNQPDPFCDVTKIPFTLRIPGVVTITIADLQGHQIKTLLHEWRPIGDHEAAFDGAGFPEGLYVYRLSVENVVKTKTMLLLR